MSDYKTIAESKNFIVLDKYAPQGKASESYQSESDLERELIQDLVNQGYEFDSTIKTPADLPTCRPADLPTCRPADLPTCRPADLPTCRPAG